MVQLVMTKSRKKLKCQSTDKWINKIGCNHSMSYYLVIKNEVLIHDSTQKNLKILCYVKKSVTKDHILYDSINVKNPE